MHVQLLKSPWLWRASGGVGTTLFAGYWLERRGAVERVADEGVLALASLCLLLASCVLAVWGRRISGLLRAWTRDPAPPLPTTH